MNLNNYPNLSRNQIMSCLAMVDNGLIKSVKEPMTSDPVIVEENQLIRDYISYLNNR